MKIKNILKRFSKYFLKYSNYFPALGVFILIILIAALTLPFLGRGPKITSGEVVEKLRSASYLTTTKYTVKVIAKDDQGGHWYKLWLDSHKLLLFAKGTVEAGIDLSKVTPADVVVSEDGKSITVTLPPVSIHRREYSLSQKKNDTYVSNVVTGVLADTTNVQTQLRSDANDALVESACKADIMRRATLDAKLATEELLKTLLPNVNVTVLSGPVPSLKECTAAE